MGVQSLVSVSVFLGIVSIVFPLEFVPKNPLTNQPLPMSVPLPSSPERLKAPNVTMLEQFTNTSSYSSSSNSRGYSEKEISKRVSQVGDAGREMTKNFTNNDLVQRQRSDAKTLMNKYQLDKFTNSTTDVEEKSKSADGDEAQTETKSEASETSASEVVQEKKDRKTGKKGRSRKRRSGDLIVVPKAKKTIDDTVTGPKKTAPKGKKEPVAPKAGSDGDPEEDEGDEENDPSSFTFRNDEACREAFGGGKGCTKEVWEKCRTKKCPGKDKEPVYCMRSGESIYKCHLSCMQGPCGEGGGKVLFYIILSGISSSDYESSSHE